ncbi:hypothetical protein MIR68_006750 [Amoeboaphelidium protococcarum]|nr:hypothetical protein MIR68_006750 [Amoeboaphelidium protococcarum]
MMVLEGTPIAGCLISFESGSVCDRSKNLEAPVAVKINGLNSVGMLKEFSLGNEYKLPSGEHHGQDVRPGEYEDMDSATKLSSSTSRIQVKSGTVATEGSSIKAKYQAGVASSSTSSSKGCSSGSRTSDTFTRDVKMHDQEYKSSRRLKIAARKGQINPSLQNIKESENVDFAVLLDCTGSMQPWIDGVKDNILELSTRITEHYPKANFRMAFVRYTDFDMGSNNISVPDFTCYDDEFRRFVSTIKAQGGADGPEDVFGGLNVGLDKLSWDKFSTKVLVHYADAPCHGSLYYTIQDSYPGGDPKPYSLFILIYPSAMLDDQEFNDLLQIWDGRENSSFTNIMNMLHLAQRYNSYDRNVTSMITWTDNTGKSLSIDNSVISTAVIKSTIQEMQTNLTRLIGQLTYGYHLGAIQTGRVKDKTSCKRSIVDQSDHLLRLQRELVQEMMGNRLADFWDVREQMVVERTKIIWQRRFKLCVSTLATLIQLACGMPSRVEELAQIQVADTTSKGRQVYWMKDHIMLTQTYNKTSSITQRDSFIVRFLDKTTSRLVLQFVTFIQPIAYLVFEQEQKYLSFLLAGLSAEQLRETFKNNCSVGFGYPVGISQYRHAIIALMRRNCHNASNIQVQLQVQEEQAGHGADIGQQVYGRSAEATPRITEFALEEFFKVSKSWHALLQIN